MSVELIDANDANPVAGGLHVETVRDDRVESGGGDRSHAMIDSVAGSPFRPAILRRIGDLRSHDQDHMTSRGQKAPRHGMPDSQPWSLGPFHDDNVRLQGPRDAFQWSAMSPRTFLYEHWFDDMRAVLRDTEGGTTPDFEA